MQFRRKRRDKLVFVPAEGAPVPGGIGPTAAGERKAAIEREVRAVQTLVDSLVADYYRAYHESLPIGDWQRGYQHGRMQQAVDVLARVTATSPIEIVFALEHGVEIDVTGMKHGVVVNRGPQVGPPYDVWIQYADGRVVSVEEALAAIASKHARA